MTENQTQAGQSSQSTRASRLRQTPNMTTPTMNASIEWRLGIAAYGFAVRATSPDSWLRLECCASVSTNPHSGNSRGGAVGTSDVTDEADQVRSDQPVAEAGELLVMPEVDPEQREADDGELGEPVRVRRRGDQDRRRVDDPLQRAARRACPTSPRSGSRGSRSRTRRPRRGRQIRAPAGRRRRTRARMRTGRGDASQPRGNRRLTVWV